MSQTEQPKPTMFERLGGAEFFADFTRVFYEGVRGDDLLAPMYPQDDLPQAERSLRMFLEQYWGGPTTYGEERGHPRLRMRHAPFVIDPDARDRWLLHAHTAWLFACAKHQVNVDDATQLWDYLYASAYAMVNSLPTP